MAESLVISAEQAAQVFSEADSRSPDVLQGEPFMANAGIELQFGAVTLGLEEAGQSRRVVGNTVPRLCDAADSCTATACGLGRLAMTIEQRRNENCAAVNTVPAFMGRPGYVLTPLSPNVVFLSDPDNHQPVTALDAAGEEMAFFGKVKTGAALALSEHDIPEDINQEGGIAVEMNVADSTTAVATFATPNARYAVVDYSSRENFGTPVLGRAISSILDREGLEGEVRESVLANLRIRIDVGYSATLKKFECRNLTFLRSLLTPI